MTLKKQSIRSNAIILVNGINPYKGRINSKLVKIGLKSKKVSLKK
jgi:hypothetical protein